MTYKEKTRLLLVANIYPPDIGGPATFASRVANRISCDPNWKLCVFANTTEREFQRREGKGRLVRRRFDGSLYQKIIARLFLFREMLIAHLVLVVGLDAIACSMARLLRKKFVIRIPGDSVWQYARNSLNCTETIDEFARMPVLHPKVEKLVKQRKKNLDAATAIIVPSQYLRGLVMNWGVPSEKIFVIPNGVDLEAFKQQSTRQNPGELLEVAFVGRLTNWKGVDTLLLAAKSLPFVNLTIIGEGPERVMLESLCDNLDIRQRTKFTGKLNEKEIIQILRHVDTVVLPSLYEGMSHVLQESLAMGIPPIATRACGNGEIIIDEQNGLLIAPRNVNSLVQALERLHRKPDLYNHLAKNAKLSSNRFSMEDTARAYAGLLQKLLEA